MVLIHPSTRVVAMRIASLKPWHPKITVTMYDSVSTYEQSWWTACTEILNKGYVKGKGKGYGDGKGKGKGKGKGDGQQA